MVRGHSGDRGIGVVGIVLVLLVLVVAGVAVAFVVGPFGTPSVEGVSNHFGGVTASETVVVSGITVNNPNPVGVGTGDVTVAYAVDMNGIRMASGQKTGVSIGTGESTVALRTAIDNRNIPEWWVSHLRNGEQSTVVVHATVSSGALDQSVEAPQVEKQISTDITSSLNSTERRPIEANQEPVVQDPVLYVEETSGWWGEITEDTTAVEMRFRVRNPKSYPISIQEVRYNVTMNGIHVGDGSTERSYTIPPGGTETVAATLVLQNGAFDDWWVSHLRRNQVTDLAMDLSMVVDLSEGGGPTLEVPIDTIEHTIETDVFGNKDRYPTGNGSGAAGTPTEGDEGDDGGTPTEAGDEGGEATSTPTPTPSPTPTPTPTPTDDGLLDLSADRLREAAR